MLHCPTCQGQVSAAASTFPFCGERCRLLDLGNWLDERYRIAPLDDAIEGPGDDEGEAPAASSWARLKRLASAGPTGS